MVRETLRVSAIVSSRLPLMPRDELPFQDWVIPANTPVGMTPRSILLDPSVFPNPNDFIPQRWLLHDPLGQRNNPERYFVAFGKGARMCQGMHFALTEIYTALTALFRRFDFELVDTIRERDVNTARDCFLAETVPGSSGVKIRVVGERV